MADVTTVPRGRYHNSASGKISQQCLGEDITTVPRGRFQQQCLGEDVMTVHVAQEESKFNLFVACLEWYILRHVVINHVALL